MNPEATNPHPAPEKLPLDCQPRPNIRYDIIGDVHGRFDKLADLMDHLGYGREGDCFIPPAGHRALFLGDLIDPKPGYAMPGGVSATLRAVKEICDRGDALCLIGNHEFNAVCYHNAAPSLDWPSHANASLPPDEVEGFLNRYIADLKGSSKSLTMAQYDRIESEKAKLEAHRAARAAEIREYSYSVPSAGDHLQPLATDRYESQVRAQLNSEWNCFLANPDERQRAMLEQEEEKLRAYRFYRLPSRAGESSDGMGNQTRRDDELDKFQRDVDAAVRDARARGDTRDDFDLIDAITDDLIEADW